MKKYTLSQIINSMAVCIIVCTSCSRVPAEPTPTPPVETSALPTPAATLPELINDLSSNDMGVRLVSIYTLEEYGDDAVIAIPLLRENLEVNDVDVREAAAYALGKLGSKAQKAVPDLIIVIQDDSSYHVRDTAIEALGLIGDSTAIPALATILFEERTTYDPWYGIPISCADAIATITDERFTDTGKGIYTLNEDGIPLLVIDAREWWQEEGQYQNWINK